MTVVLLEDTIIPARSIIVHRKKDSCSPRARLCSGGAQSRSVGALLCVGKKIRAPIEDDCASEKRYVLLESTIVPPGSTIMIGEKDSCSQGAWLCAGKHNRALSEHCYARTEDV